MSTANVKIQFNSYFLDKFHEESFPGAVLEMAETLVAKTSR